MRVATHAHFKPLVTGYVRNETEGRTSASALPSSASGGGREKPGSVHRRPQLPRLLLPLSFFHFGRWVGEEVGRDAAHFGLEPKWYSGFFYTGGVRPERGSRQASSDTYVSRRGSSLPSNVCDTIDLANIYIYDLCRSNLTDCHPATRPQSRLEFVGLTEPCRLKPASTHPWILLPRLRHTLLVVAVAPGIPGSLP